MDPFVATAETHISVVFFVGDRAYKLKKPVTTGFLDFSTREAREAVCHREVELNRRLAPDVYLGVADLHGPDGEPLDHLVVMRRMPPERRLSTLVREGEPSDCIRHVARTIAAFHEAAETSPEISQAGSVDAVRRNWDENARQMEPYIGDVLDADTARRVEELAHRYLEGRGPLFGGRVASGRIRDGHGDLLADDVFCLDDGPRILDCIEFDDRLRHGDVMADAAFLAMDLCHLGSPALAERFLGWYREFSADDAPASLVDHYVAYRAQVRSKVACLRHEQGDVDAAADARRLLDLCAERLERARIRLLLVGGLPGTGKSTLARGLADARGWSVLRSDEVRKDLAGVVHTEGRAADYEEGLYTAEMTEATYSELLERARRLLALGETVVLDASWTDASRREDARRTALDTSSDLHELRCVVSADEASRRLSARTGDASDATPDVADRMAAHMDPWPDAIEIATSGSPEDARDRALGLVGP